MNLSVNHLELPVTIVPDIPMDDDELMRFCAENSLFRIERTNKGELRVMSPAGGGTSNRNGMITRFLFAWAEDDGRGVAFDSSGGFTLPDGAMLNPDGSWVERRRWDALSARDQARFSPICPDFVLELRSPSDRLPELQAKMGQWMDNGAQVGWLIDPFERAVTIYRQGQEPETLVDPTSVQGDGPVAGFELVMNRIW